MNTWTILLVVVLVGLAVYNIYSWSKRNQAIKDYTGKMAVTFYLKSGIEKTYIMEVNSPLISAPEESEIQKAEGKDGGKYKVLDKAIYTKPWPPDASLFNQVMLRGVSFFEGISDPIMRPEIVDSTPLPEQLRFASNMAYMDWTARFSKNLADMIAAIKHPKQPLILYLLIGGGIIASLVAAWFSYKAYTSFGG